ncbi:DUF2254 domain-containing protein [Chitinispirillales bacterium ANBcel5]|uniref:DUF2254 domain-containing protein n=1 Tax=Cellulosispirillum alkaliphilum TaxID=3039283 RepID=UPI002A5106AF|nr:DUF2254 domain-containing protein [Chitinispirillales bacterium ANBcel5]
MALKTKFVHIFRHRSAQLWLAPVFSVFLAALLAALIIWIDVYADWGEEPPFPVFVGQADTARDLLSVIAASVTTLLALIFTIITVAIQLASSQYSPRTLKTLLTDRPSHFTIGIFVGTFTYTLIVLLSLRAVSITPQDTTVVAGLSMTGAFVLAVLSLGTFAIYSNHILHSVRITSLISRVATITRDHINRYYPHEYNYTESAEKTTKWRPPVTPVKTVHSPAPGVFTDLKEDRLLELASDADCTLVIVPPLGAYVPGGAPIIRVYGEGDLPENLQQHITLETERSFSRDISYGIRQLVDIAIRALSTGINDPSTAVDAIDHLHDLLRIIARRELPGDEYVDSEGKVRLIVRTIAWEDTVRLALDEIRLYGKTSLHVVRRLQAMLDDLIEVCPQPRLSALIRQRDLLNSSIAQELKSD